MRKILLAITSHILLIPGTVLSQVPDCQSLAQKAPRYKVARRDYTTEKRRLLFLRITINPRAFNRDDLLALSCKLDADYQKEDRLFVMIFDNHDSALIYRPRGLVADPPISEKDRKSLRAQFARDSMTGEHWIAWYPDPQRQETVRVDLKPLDRHDSASQP
jgi:hypothetical protein